VCRSWGCWFWSKPTGRGPDRFQYVKFRVGVGRAGGGRPPVSPLIAAALTPTTTRHLLLGDDAPVESVFRSTCFLMMMFPERSTSMPRSAVVQFVPLDAIAAGGGVDAGAVARAEAVGRAGVCRGTTQLFRHLTPSSVLSWAVQSATVQLPPVVMPFRGTVEHRALGDRAAVGGADSVPNVCRTPSSW